MEKVPVSCAGMIIALPGLEVTRIRRSNCLLRVVVLDLTTYQAFPEEKLTPLQGIDSIQSSLSLKQVQFKTKLPLGHLEPIGLDTKQK
jgi:hypothetical protein